jgi:flagellar biosynthesis activator protein FlaF
MALKAYQRAQAAAETPRGAEYRLFGQVTGALIEASRSGAKGKTLLDAIDWNRRMWGALAGDCMSDSNTLSRELRAQIVSLSIWVNKYSSEVLHKNAPLDPLINVNRNVMQGLQQRAA